MPTSGTATFNPSIDVIIEEAFERAGSELRSGYDVKSARRSLDIMSAEWSNRGINLWTVEQGSISLVDGTATYNLPNDTIDLIEYVVRQGTGVNQVDLSVTRIGVNQYSSIPTKNQEGLPLQIYVNRATTTPTVTLWPIPDSGNYTLVYWRLRRIQDTGAATNTMDVPSRFIPAMVAGLAYYIAMKRPNLMERLPFLKGEYDEQFRLAYEEDRERVPLRIVPFQSVS